MSTPFAKKTLTEPKRVCLRLKEAREAKGISLEDLALQTKINPRYLRAIEECHFESIPCATTYKKNFVKRYAATVSLNIDEIVQQFTDEELKKTDGEAPTLTNLETRALPNIPSLIRTGVIAVLIILCASYLGLQLGNLVAAPALTIGNPADGTVTNNKTMQLTGTASTAADVYINNELVTARNDKAFEATLTLAPGTNTVVVRAQKKHGKTSTETIHIIYNEPAQVSLR